VIVDVPYVEDKIINEDMFSANLKKKSNSERTLKNCGRFRERKKLMKWSDCVGVYTDAARVMTGNKGLQVVIKRPAPEAVWAHYTIHCESLATKELCSELSEVRDAPVHWKADYSLQNYARKWGAVSVTPVLLQF
jgi:hypothetical protein